MRSRTFILIAASIILVDAAHDAIKRGRRRLYNQDRLSDLRREVGWGFIFGSSRNVKCAGANVLVSGFQKSIARQPISFEGQTGVNVAAGVAALNL